MHIAYITSEYPYSKCDAPVGGIGTFTKTIAEALVHRGNRISVFVHSQKKDERFNENGVEIYHIKTYRIKGLTWLSNRFNFNRVLSKIIKAQGIDLIEAPEWTGFTAGMQFRCPLILRLHGSDTFFCDLEGRKVKLKNNFFEKLSLLGATKVIGVSAFVATATKSLFNLKNDIEVVYNGVDTSSLVPDHSKIEKQSVLYFGSIIRKKGVLELAKAFNKVVEKLPDAKLYYLGRDVIDNLTGRSTLTLVKEILSAKAYQNFTYLGTKPYSEVQEIIKTKEIVVLPSHAEAFPMSWLEAMALEKKMVTSNIGWSNELMLDNKTGITINPNDCNALSQSIIGLLGQKLALGVNARKHVQSHFDLNLLLDENIKVYKSLVKK